MEIKKWHQWHLGTDQALDIQRRLQARVSRIGRVISPHFIAGVDIAVGKTQGMAQAAVTVLSYPELRLVEVELAQGELDFPYIPGLLSFRELPLILAACQKLSLTPDLILVDGQGVAHPRRMGLASHLGLFLNTPTVGCAKSRLCGSHQIPEDEPGSFTELVDGGETIGVALRTRLGVKPIFVSTGHKIDLENSIYWVLKCLRGYRLPEPTRLAHLAAGGSFEQKIKAVVTGGSFKQKIEAVATGAVSGRK